MKVKMKLKIKYKAFVYKHVEELEPLVLEKPSTKPSFLIPHFNTLKPSFARS